MNTPILTALALALGLVGAVQSKDKRDFSDQYPLGDCTFTTTGNNPYFTLQAGRQLYFNNLSCLDEGECDELSDLLLLLPATLKSSHWKLTV